MIIDYYSILKVPPEADLETIKKAYRARAMESHPDRGGSHQAMLKINEAFEILSNPELRQRYDEARRDPFNKAAQEQANYDASGARQKAEDYPPDWNAFEAFLSNDIKNAKYGTAGQLPTVSNSFTGCFFWVGGAIVGLIVVQLFYHEGSSDGSMLFKIGIIGGAGVGILIHQLIGQSMKGDKTSSDASSNQTSNQNGNSGAAPPQSTIISCPKCSQKLRIPDSRKEIRLRCRACSHEFMSAEGIRT